MKQNPAGYPEPGELTEEDDTFGTDFDESDEARENDAADEEFLREQHELNNEEDR
jgi:hypothetical protein